MYKAHFQLFEMFTIRRVPYGSQNMVIGKDLFID